MPREAKLCTCKPSELKKPDMLWAYIRSAANGSGSRRTHPVELSIKTTLTGIEVELIGTDTDSVCTCPDCALWLFVAHTCRCCGMRERQLFTNSKKKQEAEKLFKEKHGLLKCVEAGENVRNRGRVDLAFQNGDILSIGICCGTDRDDKIFCSIVDAIKGTAGVVLCQETRCQAYRRGGENSIRSDSQDVTHVIDEEEFASAERHMQELLAMEERSKSAIESVATPSRRSQRKSKKKGRPQIPAQSPKMASSEEGPFQSNESSQQDAASEEITQETGTANESWPDEAEIPRHSLGEPNATNVEFEDLPKKVLFIDEKYMQTSSTAMAEEANETPNSSGGTVNTKWQLGAAVIPEYCLEECHDVTFDVNDFPLKRWSSIEEDVQIASQIMLEEAEEANEAPDSSAPFSIFYQRQEPQHPDSNSSACTSCNFDRSQADSHSCQASKAFTNSECVWETPGKVSAKFDFSFEPSQVECSRKRRLLDNLGPPPTYPPPPPPPPPFPVGRDIEAQRFTIASKTGVAAAAAAVDIDDLLVVVSCRAGDANTPSPAHSTLSMSCHHCHSIVDTWNPLEPPWNPMQSRLGLRTGGNDFLCPHTH